jgi:hypothetical protein
MSGAFGQVVPCPAEVRLVDLDGGLPVVGGHHNLDVGHRFGAVRGQRPAPQNRSVTVTGMGLPSPLIGGARADPAGRFGACNDLGATRNGAVRGQGAAAG